jgi:hypothetical protein
MRSYTAKRILKIEGKAEWMTPEIKKGLKSTHLWD